MLYFFITKINEVLHNITDTILKNNAPYFRNNLENNAWLMDSIGHINTIATEQKY